VEIHKIASCENTHLRLLEAVAKTGKPVIMSTGASNIEEIAWAVDFFRSNSQRH
ncbi:MAG: N-acetylneuraminate synthase family protein, partial [Candidatus Obscuribacter sp.]|nr:N-acetylneuraminate synthase family protein [Candidatus Obscuribacter sp.]